ncbi:hypothetical protein ACLOJK_035704 [Asimina triloba]
MPPIFSSFPCTRLEGSFYSLQSKILVRNDSKPYPQFSSPCIKVSQCIKRSPEDKLELKLSAPSSLSFSKSRDCKMRLCTPKCSAHANLTLPPPRQYLLPTSTSSFTELPAKPPKAKLTIHTKKFAKIPSKQTYPINPITHSIEKPLPPPPPPPNEDLPAADGSDKLSRMVVLGAASLGVALVLVGMDGGPEALALGPNGPMMEDFWDNMRRYGLYVLTVGTGAIYTIFQPIVELLKRPLSAILIIAISVGSFYILTQVLNAMVGISEFPYDYGY